MDSVLKADVWRDHLLQEETTLNTKLAELEAEGDDKRFVDAREEASSRLAEVHARLADMEAESGPARAAALLAGVYPRMPYLYLRHDYLLGQVWGSVKRTKNVLQNPLVVVGGTSAQYCRTHRLTDRQNAPCPGSRPFRQGWSPYRSPHASVN